MKIQYLVNWSFTYQCRMSSFTRALSLPSSSASLSFAVATQNASKLTIFRFKKIKGGHPLPTTYSIGAFGARLGSRLWRSDLAPNFKTVVAPLER